MDEDEITSSSTIEDNGSTLYAGAFFPGAQHIHVSGGTFTSHVHQGPPSRELEPFRRLRRGDIDLRQTRWDGKLGTVSSGARNAAVRRRICSAVVDGKQSEVSVFLYEGDDAEQKWRDFLARHTNLWHPNIVQIFAISTMNGTYAAVAHDDLLPYSEFMASHRPSPIMTVLAYVCWSIDNANGWQYVADTLPRLRLTRADLTGWILRSTGRLCLEFTPSQDPELDRYPHASIHDKQLRSSPQFDLINFTDRSGGRAEACAVEYMTIYRFHDVCYWELAQWRMGIVLAAHSSVSIGAVVLDRGAGGGGVQVARLPDIPFSARGWEGDGVEEETMSDGWIRFEYPEIRDQGIVARASMKPWECDTIRQSWLAQANCIFDRLQVTSGHSNYILVEDIQFSIHLNPSTTENQEQPEHGYLFLFPAEHLSNNLRPKRLWFWSLQPHSEPLTDARAKQMGFPSVELRTEVSGCVWSADVYEGLRAFHAAKGLDAGSGEALYEISADRGDDEEGVPFCDEENSEEAHSWSWHIMSTMKLAMILVALLAYLFSFI
ncbi:hypothetical protein FB45DRAFT_932299 [Roridomyces roridus]|uniref:Uncharacterized protein n=1 Tax=Roridomyces roridus TaxID=1738132 RepID=A0AAD7BEW5_9AGAR|nr:hypothetical protein FB45DRAFT_932299 [Roridomyces roridus]